MEKFGYGLVLVCFAVAASVLMGTASAVIVTWTVDDDGDANFARIQDAVNASSDGDTIEVRSGTYVENVDVNKSLTLIGDGADVVTVRAEDGSDHVFEVTEDYVNIGGFTVTGATGVLKAGVYLDGADYCNILDTNASKNNHGICLVDSSDNMLQSNTVLDNEFGIRLLGSSNNELTNNTMSDNSYNFGVLCTNLSDYIQNIDTSNTVDGKPIYYWVNQQNQQIPNDAGYVGIVNSTNITVKDLTLTNNGQGVLFACTSNSLIKNVNASNYNVGIDLHNSSNNTLTNNNASGNNDGIGIGINLDSSSNNTLTNNNASGNNDGIGMAFSNNNTLTSNKALGNVVGIVLSYSSDNNTLTNNNASGNVVGIYLYNSSNNTLTSNTVSENGYGISLDSSSSNALTNNTASDNTGDDLYIEDSESAFRDNTLSGTTISFTYEGDVSLKGVGSPAADPTGWNTIGKFIRATNQSAGAWIFLNFSYSGSDLSGLDESSLKVWKHNGTTWIEDGWNGTRYLDTEGDVIGVNITSFSVFAPGALSAPPINCTCGNICVNQTGWWRDGGAFNASGTPIQAAIDSATDGDIICVWNGSYSENVDVPKRLTLRGEGADVVTLTAADAGVDVFNVTADYVNISGFTVTLATGWPKAGFYLDDVDYCNISDNNASENYYGIYSNSSCCNTLVNNTFLDNYKGVYLHSSNNNTITDNIANSNDGWGILLSDSSNNTLTNNTISENDYNFDIGAWRLSDYVQNIDASNTVDGKPIYYWVNQQNQQIPNDAGYVGVVNSTNITVKDLTLINNGQGVLFVHTSNSRIENVNTANNTYGILLKSSNDNGLTDNTAVSNNFYGICLGASSNNKLMNNTANSNNFYGIYLSYSSNNTLANNNASDNIWDDLYIENSESAFSDNTLNETTISFTYEGDVSLKGVGTPAADPAGWNTIGKFISATNQSVGAWIFLNFSYSGSDLSGLDESSLKVWKHNGTTWMEDGWNETRYLDIEDDVVGVNITSFSVFAPAALAAAAYIPPDPTGLANTTGRYWVNYTWSAGTGTGNVTDSYNVSVNEAWTNGTTDTFMNVSVAPGGWANITVFAYNASGTGTLSLESISDNVWAPGEPCTCGNICVNQTGWWRDGGAFNASETPIQAAIDSATDGDTICVWNGSYNESVDVNKRLTLRGEGADVVTLTAADADVDVINVTADYVNISGFTVMGGGVWNLSLLCGSLQHLEYHHIG